MILGLLESQDAILLHILFSDYYLIYLIFDRPIVSKYQNIETVFLPTIEVAIPRILHTSPTDVLNAHTLTLPVGKALHKAAVKFASLHSSHPLYKQYKPAGARIIKHHRLALHHMTQLYRICTDQVETICWDMRWHMQPATWPAYI